MDETPFAAPPPSEPHLFATRETRERDAARPAALPAVPPVPLGERVQPKARGVATLIAGLESAVIDHQSDDLRAMVVVVNGKVIDAVAETRDGVVKGIEVLDELADLGVNDLKVTRVEARLAQVIPAYWRAPGASREVIQSFIRPGRRGAIAVTAPRGTGVLLFDEKGVVASYRDGAQQPGGSALDELLDDPDVVLSARSDAMPPGASEAAATEHPPAQAEPPVQRPPAPPEQSQGGGFPPPARPPQPPPGTPGPMGRPFGPPPAPNVAPPAPPNPEFDQRQQAIVAMVRQRLQRAAGPVEEQFQSARSIEDLVVAAERVRNLQLRMVNPLTLQGIADDAGAIARGERPTG
jgi:hypothetical protein